MLTIADGGGRGVQEPLILADVICEQPLMEDVNDHIVTPPPEPSLIVSICENLVQFVLIVFTPSLTSIL